MNQPCPSSIFQALFNTALQDYKDKTGISLVNHPFAEQFQKCESVESITTILEEQARIFRNFRDHGKLVNSLKRLVVVFCSPLFTTVLGKGIGLLPFPPANAIFAAICTLLAAVNDISTSYDALVDLFASFENFLSRLGIYTEIPLTTAVTNVLVKIIVELISTLALATKQVKQGRFMKFMGKLRGEKDIEATIQRLDRLTLDEGRATAAQTLEVVYDLVRHRKAIMDDSDGNEPSTSISRALESMQEIVTKMNQAERDKLQQDVRNWLSPPDPWKNHNLARGSRHSGTGSWWIEGGDYAEWKSSGSNSILWIHGKPGAGKSVICSAIVDDIRALQKSGLASLAFFYCDFREGQKKDVHGLLSSLLVQLGDQSDIYSATLSDFYTDHRRGSQRASDDELLDCLKDMLKLPGQATVHIIIDGLDECPTTTGMPSPRENVFGLLEELVGLHIPNLRICVTSRPEADISEVLQPLVFRSISLHEESGQVDDIAGYVKSMIHKDRKMRRWSDGDQQLVVDVLTRKADGMFRYVFCQLEYIRHCPSEDIQRALNGLPATLDGTYARTLEDIGDQNWERARRLFQCVSVAARPLRVEELTDILAFDFEVGSTPRYQAGRRSVDPVHTVLSTCFSLLAVVDVDGSRVVQFAHFSVKEYLTSERLAKTTENISRFHVSMTPAHTIIAQACLGVLLFLDKNITKDRLKDFPLVEYAAEYWPAHARFDNVSSNILDEMKRLFDPRKHHLSAWLWLYNPICPEDPFERPETDRPNKPGLTPLYYAAACGFCDVGTFLIVERWEDLCSQAVDYDATPLHLASEFGHAGFAQLLLGLHADSMNAVDDSGFTPLCRASYEGHAEVIQVLVKKRADKETNRNDFNLTPLQLALHKGHVEAARVLLSHKADTEVRDGGTTPLQLASKSGQLAVVRMLFEHGASTEARDDRGFTPLHLASESGELEVSRILIEHGAGLETSTPSGCTPIHFANEAIARLLIERGADAEALDDGVRTPLHHASERGCIGAARVLLENGVDAGALDADYATPLDLVPPSTNSWDRKDLVELLLEYSPSGSCTGKRRSDSPGESDSGKRLRLDAVDVEERPASRGSEDADVLMVVDS